MTTHQQNILNDFYAMTGMTDDMVNLFESGKLYHDIYQKTEDAEFEVLETIIHEPNS